MPTDPLAWMHDRPLGVMATSGADGVPHAVPVEVIVHDGRVYSWGQRTSVRARNIERTGTAAVVAYKGHAFVLVRGNARLLDMNDEPYAAITRKFLDKYGREETYGNDTLLEVTPERISSVRIDPAG
jgi:general stress protein 26